MNRNNNFSRSGKPNDFNNRASHSNTTRNKNVDTIEMISIPDIDYDEEPEHQNVEYDVDEDYRLGPEDGLERTVNDMRPVPNRFKPNDYQINELLSRRPKQLTMRHARKIALQLGLFNQINSNQEFEPDYGHDNSSTFSVSLESKRLCWARKCKKDNCETHLRTGFENDDNQIEFHLFNNQTLNQAMDRFYDFWSYFKIWSRDLRKIEAFYGTGIVSFFHFLRRLLFINFLIALSVILLIIVPQTSFKTKSAYNMTSQTNKASEKPSALDFLQGTGYLESSITFIGSYDRKVTKLPLLGWSYDITLAYMACTLFYFLFCFVLMLKYTTDGMRDTLLAEEHQQYSSMIFCGWDYCTRSEKRFKFKQKSIAMEIKELREVDSRKEMAAQRTPRERAKLLSIRIFIFLIVAIILGASFIAIFYVTQLSAEYEGQATDTMMRTFITEYSPTLTIFALYMIAPSIFDWLVKFEKYDSQATVVKITLMRMVFLRMASVIVLLITLLNTLKKKDKSTYLKAQCWENYIGQSFYKLMIGDLILETFSILIYDSFKKYILTKSALARKVLDFQKFDIPRNVLSLVYIQALCWLGTFYCPLMPVICVVRLFILFYIQKFTLKKNCSPPDQAYRASRSNIIFISVLIVSYFISAIPIAYSIGSSEREPSDNCGPFAKYDYMWKPIEELIAKKSEVKTTADLITSSASTLGVTFFLCLLTYYYYVRGLMHKKMIGAVHLELKEIANDRIYLIDQLSLINIKQELSKN